MHLIDEPHRYDFDLKQGATWRKDFVWLLDGSPVDLSGVTGEARFKINHGATDTIMIRPVSVTNPTGGEFRLEIASSITDAISFPSLFEEADYDNTQSVAVLVYDIDLTDGSDRVTVISGLCRFHAGV